MIRWRSIILVLLLCFISLILSSCGGGNSGPTEETIVETVVETDVETVIVETIEEEEVESTPPEPAKTVTVFAFADDDFDQAKLEEAVRQFSAETGIIVELEIVR